MRAPERALDHDETGRPDERDHTRDSIMRATPPSDVAAKHPSRTRSALAGEHRAERSLFADGAAACGVLHVARDAMQQIDSGRSHAGKYVAWHQAPPSRSLGRDRPCDLA